VTTTATVETVGGVVGVVVDVELNSTQDVDEAVAVGAEYGGSVKGSPHVEVERLSGFVEVDEAVAVGAEYGGRVKGSPHVKVERLSGFVEVDDDVGVELELDLTGVLEVDATTMQDVVGSETTKVVCTTVKMGVADPPSTFTIE
jgi:hypothetical protein